MIGDVMWYELKMMFNYGYVNYWDVFESGSLVWDVVMSIGVIGILAVGNVAASADVGTREVR